jgi:hypothetical protein
MPEPLPATPTNTFASIGKEYSDPYVKLQVVPNSYFQGNPTVVNISGHKAMVFTNVNGFDDYYVYLDDNKYLLLISVSKQVGEKEIADQILSTFKFTN